MRRRLRDYQHLLESAEFNRRRYRHAQEQARPLAMHALDGANQQAARNDVALATRQQFYEVVKAVKLIGVTNSALQVALKFAW